MKQLIPLLLLTILLAAPLQANQDGIVVRTAAVHAQPGAGSKRVGQLTAGAAIAISTRRGGWKKITAKRPALSGWVRSYQVRQRSAASTVAAESGADSRGFLSGLASFSRKASRFFKSDKGATSAGTATIGVRGLSEDEIKSAQADFVEFEKMKQFASDGKRAHGFARKGGLSAVEIPHLSGKK